MNEIESRVSGEDVTPGPTPNLVATGSSLGVGTPGTISEERMREIEMRVSIVRGGGGGYDSNIKAELCAALDEVLAALRASREREQRSAQGFAQAKEAAETNERLLDRAMAELSALREQTASVLSLPRYTPVMNDERAEMIDTTSGEWISYEDAASALSVSPLSRETNNG